MNAHDEETKRLADKLRSMKPAGREMWDGERWWTWSEMLADGLSRLPKHLQQF